MAHMLDYLRIRNLALIENMELEFAPGMNVLTGETGAGKSFILKALGFLLGDKLTADSVRAGADRAQVEALFALPEGDLLLRRELVAESGRSRLYINDDLGSQEGLRQWRPKLVTFTSQHAQQKLLQPAFQSALLERHMDCEALVQRRDALVATLRDAAARRASLVERQQSLAEKRELLELQQQEIDKVSPQEGEEERLEALRSHVRAAKQRREHYAQALALLHGEDRHEGLLDALGRLEKVLHALRQDDESLEVDADTVASLRQQLMQLGSKLRHPPALTGMDGESVDINEVEERLFALAQLKRKLHRSLPELLALRTEIAQNLSFLDSCALDVHLLDKTMQATIQELSDVITRIQPARRSSAATVTRALEQELRQLGFAESVQVRADFTAYELWPGVKDEQGHILWAPNPGQPPQALDKIASGGELSRFLLALAGIQREEESATFIFDEVDAGVGGLTLNKLAEKLADLARDRQMILITHWPQLAARARKHFQITKSVHDGTTFTRCSPLSADGRHAELVRMAGGGLQGEALATELLKSFPIGR